MNERHKAVQEMRERRLADRDRMNTGNYAKRNEVTKQQSRQPRHNSRQHTQGGKGARTNSAAGGNDDIEALLENREDGRGAMPQRKPKQQTKQPMQATQADFQLKKVRQAREQIDQQTKEYQDEYKKVQGEI